MSLFRITAEIGDSAPQTMYVGPATAETRRRLERRSRGGFPGGDITVTGVAEVDQVPPEVPRACRDLLQAANTAGLRWELWVRDDFTLIIHNLEQGRSHSVGLEESDPPTTRFIWSGGRLSQVISRAEPPMTLTQAHARIADGTRHRN